MPIQAKKENEPYVKKEKLPVRHVVRGISKLGITVLPENGPEQYAVQDVEARLAEYYKQGYKLLETHYLGETPDVYMMLYVLILS